MRLFVGRGRTCQQAACDMTGERLAQAVSSRKPAGDVFSAGAATGFWRGGGSRWRSSSGQPLLVRNAEELNAASLVKADLLEDLVRLLPPSAAEPMCLFDLRLGLPGGTTRAVAWNAQALMAASARYKERKLCHMSRLARWQVVCIRETREG